MGVLFLNPFRFETGAAQLLLDTYTSSLAAYSIRKLSSSYSGSAIRIRRDSDNTEQDFGFDSNGELDTTSIETFCSPSSNAYVTIWYDQSGNGNDAVQSTASQQPQIVSLGSVLTNYGKPSIVFDGTNDWLNGNISDSTYNQFFMVKDTAGDTSLAFSGAVRLTDSRYDTTSDDITFSASAGLFNIDNTNVKGYLNGVDETDVGVTAFAQNFNRLYLGSINGNSGFGSGDIQELIVFDADYSSNRTDIESNINGYFGVY